MKIIQLTESEAANASVMALVSQHLLGANDFAASFVVPEPKPPSRVDAVIAELQKATIAAAAAVPSPTFTATIAPADRPDAGFPPDPPPRPDPADPATIGFGSPAPTTTERIYPTPHNMVLPFPGATVPVQASLVTPADLDVHGLPWDPRIHSSGENKKNADGSWRRKRGVKDEEIATVEAQLRQIMSFPTLAQAPVAAPVIPMPPVPAVVAPPASITFAGWMEELSPAMNRNFITQELFTQLIKSTCGPDADMQALVMRPDLIPPVRVAMQQWLDANHPGWANVTA